MSFQALALLRAGVHSGQYYEATDEGGELIGYTLWMPPGQEMFSTYVYNPMDLTVVNCSLYWISRIREGQRALGFNEFMSKLSSEAANYFKTKVSPLILFYDPSINHRRHSSESISQNFLLLLQTY